MKVFMTSRAFLILSFLWLFSIPSYAFFQNASARVKTKYEFTDTRISEADTLLKNREYQSALEAYQKAYDIYETESFYEGMVYAKERMGRTYRSLRKDSLSKITYQAAAALSREKLGPNHILESKAYLNNGIRAHRMRRFKTASFNIDTSAWVYEKSLWFDSTVLADIIEYKFYSYYYSDLSNDTLVKYLDEKAKFYEKSGSTVEEDIFLFSAYNRAFFKSGDFQKSIAYGLEAVRRAETADVKIDPFYYTDALFSLGRSLHSQEELEKALSVADKLIGYTLEHDPKSGDLPAYWNLKAVVLNGLDRFEEAALEFQRIIGFLDAKEIRSNFYRNAIMNLGVCYQKMKSYAKAETYLHKALELQKENIKTFDASFVPRYRYIGQLYAAKNDYSRAVLYYDSAIRCAIPSYSGPVLSYPKERAFSPTFELLSLLRNKQVNIEKQYSEGIYNDSTELLLATLEYAENTHKYLLSNRKELQASAGKLLLSKVFKGLYESALRATFLLHNSGETPTDIDLFKKAFDFLAFSKSNLFLEQSGEIGKVQTGAFSEENTSRYYKLKTEIASLERKFYELFDEIITSDSLRMINAKLMSLNSELEGVVNLIDEYESNEDQWTSGYKRVLKTLKDDTSLGFLEFFVGENSAFILFLSHEKRVLREIELDEDFNQDFEYLIGQISKPPSITNYLKDLNRYEEVSKRLYDKLLREPLRSTVGINKLTIIPDEQLSRLPFEVLVTERRNEPKFYYELDYLMKRYTINYLLSSSEITRQYKRASEGILGIGYSGKSVSQTRSTSLGALPGTEEEINFLKANVDGDYLLGEAGTKEVFLSEARNYDVLHLAIHGEANNVNRHESSLIFNGTDNILNTSDLYAANLNARLAILSACESGVGQINRGEGTFSIARGFALVGVPSVVMSLWRVNDDIGSEIMVDFHKKMIDGQSVSRALNESRRNFLFNESGQYTSHPYYWSAFVSLGEDLSLREENKVNLRIAYSIFLALVVLVIVLFYRKKRKGVN